MEDTIIKVRAHQQMKAAIMQFDSIGGCKTIVLQGYADEALLTVGTSFPVNLAGGKIKLSAWMMMDVRADKCTEDWCVAVDTAKLAKRMPKIEGDKEAFINFEYAPKPKGKGASIIFNERGTAGKQHALLTRTLPGEVDYLPMTFDDVEGAIHFYKNTGGSESIDIHIYVKMSNYGSIMEARAIISSFGVELEPNTGGTRFSELAPKAEINKSKTTKKKENTMSASEKTTTLPAPPAAGGLPTLPPPPGATETVPPTETTPAVIDPEVPVVPLGAAEKTETTTEPPPIVPTTGDALGAAPSPRSKAGLLIAAIKRCEEAGYTVTQPETENTPELETTPTIENKLNEINSAALTMARLTGEISDELADAEGTGVDPAIADQIRALLDK